MISRRQMFVALGALTCFGRSVHAAIPAKVKFPCDNLDWLSKTVDYVKSPFRGRYVLVDANGCFIKGPKVDCKEFPTDTEVKTTSEEYVVPQDMTIKEFYLIDAKNNIIGGNICGGQFKACDKITFTVSIHLPAIPFNKCDCSKTVDEKTNGVSPTPIPVPSIESNK